jgi:hypothetical protein
MKTNSDEYLDALEKEVAEMRKYEKHSRALLDLYSFRNQNNVFLKSSNEEVTDPALVFVLNQLYRVRSNLKKMNAKYEAAIPVQDVCGIEEVWTEKASPMFKTKKVKGV